LSPSPPSSGAEEDHASSGQAMETQGIASKPTKSPVGTAQSANAHILPNDSTNSEQ
jgi:hypothetical protein